MEGEQGSRQEQGQGQRQRKGKGKGTADAELQQKSAVHLDLVRSCEQAPRQNWTATMAETETVREAGSCQGAWALGMQHRYSANGRCMPELV